MGGVLAVGLLCLGIGLGGMQASAASPRGSAAAQGGTGRTAALPNPPPPTPPSCPSQYQIVQVGSGTVVSGTELVLGSQCDDCEVPISLPFQYNFYGQLYDAATATVNGQIDFGVPTDHSYNNYCLPDPNTNNALFAYWHDLTTDVSLQQCIDIGCGIYSSTTGVAPDRIFNLEYRAISLYTYSPIYFEVRLYEDQPRFDIIYTALDTETPNATIGAQKDTGSTIAQYQCPGSPGSITPGTMLIFGLVYYCATPTPTSTPSGNSRLVGHVTWQGRPAQPDPANVLPVTLTLRLQTGGPTVDYASLTTDASGFFTVPLVGLPNGTYNWRVKSAQVGAVLTDSNPGFLSTSGAVALTGAALTSVEMGLQSSGDTDNNDRVAAPDFIPLKLAFGFQAGQPSWDRRADYDGNNRISAADFVQLKLNFGHSGSPPIGPRP